MIKWKSPTFQKKISISAYQNEDEVVLYDGKLVKVDGVMERVNEQGQEFFLINMSSL